MLWRGPHGGGAASGKAGSMVASHNKGGQYLRARTTPTNPRTTAQQGVRNSLGTLASQWRSLDQDQRDAWGIYGAQVPNINALGDSIIISGIAAFVRANTPRLQAGLSVILDGPVIFDSGDNGTHEIELTNATAGTFAWGTIPSGWTDATATTAALLYTSRPQNITINFFGGPYQLAATMLAPATSMNFTPAFPIGGDQMFFRYRVTRGDGRLSPAVSDTVLP